MVNLKQVHADLLDGLDIAQRISSGKPARKSALDGLAELGSGVPDG